MILDDEITLMDSLQEASKNHLNLIKILHEQYGTFKRTEVTNVLHNIFKEVQKDVKNSYPESLLEQSGWFVDVMDEYRIVLTEHPIKCNGHTWPLLEISATPTNKGLLYSVRFYEYSCSLSSFIKTYMVDKYKLIQVGLGWVPEHFKQDWIPF